MAILASLTDLLGLGGLHTYQQLALLGSGATIVYLIYALYIYPNYLAVIRNVPGPKSADYFLGNLTDVFRADRSDQLVDWHEQYGTAINLRHFMGNSFLHISDPRALHHILLNHSYAYPKPIEVRRVLARILGHGILFQEGDDHKRQRRIMNLPFSWANVKGYGPTFQTMANKLASQIEELVEHPEKTGTPVRGDYAIVEISGWLGKATLNIIGLCGFDYDFGQLDQRGEENQLAMTFQELLKPMEQTKAHILGTVLVARHDWLTKIPSDIGKRLNMAMQLMQSEGRKMLDSRRKQAETGELEEKTDLLSILVKANMLATNKKEMLRDDELMGQITTFTLAGHETSSLTTAWILYQLSLRPQMQKKLRAEIRAAKAEARKEGRSELGADELIDLPYMDALVRETMRINPAVGHTERMAAQDDVIPLSEPVIGKNGRTITEIPIKAGQYIHIGIRALNLSKDIFGEDAREFRPERWLEEDLTTKVKGFVAWAPLLSFLGGPRGCIGYRFALLEVKVLLSTLIDRFEFLERDEGGTPMTSSWHIVTRMTVVGEEDKAGQLPLRVRKAPLS